jgi:hypothetical protein
MSDPSERGGKISSEIKPEKRPAQRGIPRGIEVLVKKASVDPAFRELLLEKRALAASEIGLELSAAENAILNSLPRTQIEQIIANTTVPDEHRRVFLGKIAAAMLALIGFGISGCSSDVQELLDDLRGDKGRRFGGIRPDDVRITSARGIMPDRPIDRSRPSVTSKAVRVPPDCEQLRVEILDHETNAVTVKVNCECPFGHGEIAIFFARDNGAQGAQVLCNPALSVVSKGKGEFVFSTEGMKGWTELLVVRLLKANPQGRALGQLTLADLKSALHDLQAGEYEVDCGIYKIVKFRKVWPS